MKNVQLTNDQFKIIFTHLTLSLGIFRLCGREEIVKQLLTTLEHLNSHRKRFGSSKKDLICVHVADEQLGFDIHLTDGNPLGTIIDEDLLPNLLIPELAYRDLSRKFSEKDISGFDESKIDKEINPIFEKYWKEFSKNGLDRFDFFSGS